MNDFETKPSAPSTSEPPNPLSGLQTQMMYLQIGLILLGGIFATFVYYQARRTRSDLETTRQTAGPMIQSFTQEKPTLDAFLAKLGEFGRTHTDFTPILAKYPWFFQVQSSNSPTALAAPAAMKPAAPTAAKPVPTSAPAPKK